MRNALVVCLVLSGCGSSSTGDAGADLTVLPDLLVAPDLVPRVASVSGDAIPFDGAFGSRIEGAEISVLEHPGMKMTTKADGHFQFDGLLVGSEVTLVLTHPDWPSTQTGTHVVPEGGIQKLTFQVPSKKAYELLAGIVGITPDAQKCQMVTTVTRIGKSLYDSGAHGEADATVAVTPSIPADAGPVYFNSNVIPDRTLLKTSDDGGVLFTNVTPGRYVVKTTKSGANIRDVTFTCRAGMLVNSSPPWGAQVY